MLKHYKTMILCALALLSGVVSAQKIDHISTFHTGVFDEGAAEIVVFDKDNNRLIFTNADANSLTWLDFSKPKDLQEIKSVNLDMYGAGINSVAYYNNVVVAAVESAPKQDPGKLVFFDKDGGYLADVTVGALPDMVTFSKDGQYVLAACEGEPSDDYTVDPNGAIAVVDLSGGVTSAKVTVLDFTAYNDHAEHLKNKGVRIFGKDASVAQDMEPEYITVANDKLAYVGCQENNALVVVDYTIPAILDIHSARYKDHSWTGGTPELDEYLLNELTDWPSLGTPAYGTGTPEVKLGGFSGLFYDSTRSEEGKHIFYAIPDRGPNGDAVSKADVTPAPTQNLRPFKLPNYQARIVKIVYDEATDEMSVDDTDQIYLVRADGVTPITGRGNVPGFDEVPVTYTDATTPWSQVDYVDGAGTEYTELPYDAFGGDFEGILRDKNGDFWMCDEYRPAVYKFGVDGVMKDRFVPEGISQWGMTIFFSEAGEGTSNNKYLEIYNPTDREVLLDDYMLVNCSNGCATEGEFEFDNTALFKKRTIAPGGVLVIAHPSAQADILAKADTTFTFLSNGDDWWAILNAADSSIVDQIGQSSNADPGNGWDVAGVTDGTKDHTLVRKSWVTRGSSNWPKSAGTSTLDSEWEVEAKPEAAYVSSNFGSHSHIQPDYGTESLPAVYNTRRANRGFEAIAYDYDRDIIYSFIQSPMYNPSSSTQNNSDVIRVLGIDLDGNPVSEYVYLLERNRDAGFADGRVDKMGDAVYMGNGKFRVLERDSGVPGDDESKKYIVEFTLVGATNILGMPVSVEGLDGKTLEEMTADELVKAGVQPVKRRVVLNLPSIGYLPSDKPEGLALIAPDMMAVINDNDFGLAGAGVSDDISLGIVYFDGDYYMDASDKDDAINFDNQPVLGMRLPDAITSIVQDEKVYILTANEGDSRDYDGFSEEVRVKDLTLDPMAYPNAAELQEDGVLGRLKTTTTMGDYDGDGDYDQIYAYGGRSFTIYDQYGNIVYDSGAEFEVVLADRYPDDFNSTNDENGSFDNRSDDKGGEPEAITTGVWRDSVYAFIGLERMGGVMVYNITDIDKVYFVDYFNNRDFSVEDVTTKEVGDLGVECVIFLDSTMTQDKKNYLVTSNEVSGTVSVFEVGQIPVMLENSTTASNWTIYPNPVNGSVLNASMVDNYSLLDVSGRVIRTVENSKTINVQDLELGTYFVRNSLGETKIFVRN